MSNSLEDHNKTNENKIVDEGNQQLSQEDINAKAKKLLRIAKTKLYYDDMDAEFIKEIKDNKEILTEWQKTLLLLAIYDKQKSTGGTAEVLKLGKRYFADDVEKTKILNRLQNKLLSKKTKAFDWETFDKLLGWNFDKGTIKRIKAKRREEENGER